MTCRRDVQDVEDGIEGLGLVWVWHRVFAVTTGTGTGGCEMEELEA